MATQHAKIVSWIKKNAIPIKTCSPESGLDDLQALVPLLEGARVVALGEATHGAREFSQLKQRILELLVEVMGFRTFGLESNFAECSFIDRYVLTGEGNPRSVMATIEFCPSWNTVEMLALIEWMRRYNEKSPPKKVRFYGFDMQYPARTVQALLRYLDAVDPRYANKIKIQLAPLGTGLLLQYVFADYSPLAVKRLARTIFSIEGRLALKQRLYRQRSSDEEWERASQHSRVLAQAFAMVVTQDGQVRDRSMAENAHWILEQDEDAKVALWAHNSHVSFQKTTLRPMGHYLKQWHKEDFLSVGFAFYEGSFLAYDWTTDPDNQKGLQVCTVGPSPVGSLGEILAKVDCPIFAIDLRKCPPDVAAGLGERFSLWETGGAFLGPEETLIQSAPIKNYDLLIFVEKTNSTTENPRLH
jgi:erythromycin esterase